MKKYGKFYWMFPAYYDTEKDEVVMDEGFINKYFFWLFEIFNTIDGFAWGLLGREQMFMMKFDKGEEDKKEDN
jgi:hypothetical protein